MDLKKLLAKVFNHFAYRNILKDFEVMSKNSKLSPDDEVRKLCLLWFALGHLNSMDKESHFNRDFNGEDTSGENGQDH